MKLDELSPEYFNKQMKADAFIADDPSDLEEELNYPKDFVRWLKKSKMKQLGAGGFSGVFSRPDLNFVIKVPHVYDRAWLKFADYCIKHQNDPHLPKIKFLQSWAGQRRNFFVAAVEKLTPLGDNWTADHAFLEYAMKVLSRGRNNGEALIKREYPELYEKYKSQLPSLAKTLDGIKKMKGTGKFDLHSGNIMFRGNTIVLQDPLYDYRRHQ